MERNKGITLIAIVITIIVLVILSTVTISLVLGSNGLFDKVLGAKNIAQMQSGREQIGLKVFELQTEKLLKGEACPLEYIWDNLPLRLQGLIVVGTKREPIEKIYVKYNGYQYEIIGTGEINFIGDVEFNEVPDLIVLRDKTVTGVEKVILSLNANVEMGSIKKIITPAGEKTETSFTYEITQNGEYEFKAVTAKGIETTKKIEIQNIKEEGLDLTGLTTGEEITHTHIYERKYDNTAHWEECYICHNIKNRVNHNLLINGTYGCKQDYGYQTQYCNEGCGYNIKLPKEKHTIMSNWKPVNDWNTHLKQCTKCGLDLETEKCKDSNGKILGCETGISGKCSTCGLTKDASKHKASYANKKENGKTLVVCGSCSKTISRYDDPIITYTSDTSAKVIFHLYLEPNVTIVESSVYASVWYEIAGCNYSKVDIKKQSDGSYIYEENVSYTKGTTVPNLYDMCIYTDYNVNGVRNAYFRIDSKVKSDNSIPKVNSVTVENKDIINGYAKKAIIIAKFTEDLDSVLQMALFDEEENMLVNWGTATKEGNNYTRTFDVISETSSTKKLIVKAKDSCNNIGEGNIQIEKLDSKAPELLSKTEYNDIWNIRKNVKLEMKDEGVGEVQIAFNDPNAYMSTTQEGNNYIKTFNFTGDVYQDVVGALYLKDGLGNITTKKITIGKIDSTSPTITKVKKENGKVIVEANDLNSTLNKEGSGIIGYAISKNKEVPANSMFQTSNEFTIENEGTYYVYVKDRAGNLSERYEM